MRDSACWKRICIPLVCLMVALTSSCGSPREEFAGQYEATGDEHLKQATVLLKLEEDGQAVQSVGGDEVRFRWKVKGDEIRFHTKSGGIVVGRIVDGAIRVEFPGKRMMVFKRTESQP